MKKIFCSFINVYQIIILNMTELENKLIQCEEDFYIAPIVLTRYLYIKEDVFASLLVSILEKNTDEALFWACELYHSGFKEETANYIMAIYKQLFRSHNPHLEAFLEKMRASWIDGPHTVATMVRNLVSPVRKFAMYDFVLGTIEPDIDMLALPERKFYVLLEPHNVEKYNTICRGSDGKVRTFLKTACQYSTRKNLKQLFQCNHKDISSKNLLEMHRDNWLYYASFSPIWEDRINNYNGIIDYENKCICFNNVDDEERFYEEYEYEPEEQNLETQSKTMHIEETVQLTMLELYEKYSGKKCIIDIPVTKNTKIIIRKKKIT